MKISRVLLSYKRTTYQLYVKQKQTPRMRALIRSGHRIAIEMAHAHEHHRQSLQHIKSVLKSHGIQYDMQRRNFLESVGRFDLVISIGGDGTFLRTAHFIKDGAPILGVNSSPEHSVGALCNVISDHFEKKLIDILEDRVKIEPWTRLQGTLNGKPIKELILNDALVTNCCPAAASRYFITYRNQTEEHRSSGIWIATPTGSTAAIGAAGGHPLHRRALKKFQFVVREPYTPLGHPYRLVHHLLTASEQVSVTSQMGDGVIYIDGPRVAYPFNFGDEASFELSDHPLYVIK